MSKNDTISEKLTCKQIRAVALLACGETQERVWQELRICRSTIVRWQQQPDFAAAVDKARRLVVKTAFDGLVSIVGRATQALRELLDSGTGSIRLKAAELVLRFARETTELQELKDRLDQIEEHIR